MAAAYAQPSHSIRATLPGSCSSAKTYCSVSLKSAMSFLRHPSAVLAILTSKLLLIQKVSPSVVRIPTILLFGMEALTLHPSTQLQKHNLEP